MVLSIHNEQITANINDLGAELVSVQNTSGKEYIYQPSAIWVGQSKNLFPNVGLAKEEYTIIRGKRYPMYQHGFAKEMTFAVAEHSDSAISFCLASNDETAKFVPYQFLLYIDFRVEGNQIVQTYRVVNKETEEMYFGIACHTGFCSAPDSYVDFLGNDNLEEVCRREMQFLTGEIVAYPLDDGKKAIKPETYGQGAHILQGFANKKIALINPSLASRVSIEFADFDYITLWSTADAEGVLCMMPWCALPDAENTSHVFEEKQGNVRLAGGETFTAVQVFTFEDVAE